MLKIILNLEWVEEGAETVVKINSQKQNVLVFNTQKFHKKHEKN